MPQTPLGKLILDRRRALQQRDGTPWKRNRVARLATVKLQEEWGLDEEELSENYLGRLEKGAIHQPAKPRLLAIADVLGLPRNEVLGIAGYPTEGEGTQLPPEIIARLATLSPAALEVLMDYVPTAEKLGERLTVGAGVASGDMHTMNIDTSPQKRARLGRELRGEV